MNQWNRNLKEKAIYNSGFSRIHLYISIFTHTQTHRHLVRCGYIFIDMYLPISYILTIESEEWKMVYEIHRSELQPTTTSVRETFLWYKHIWQSELNPKLPDQFFSIWIFSFVQFYSRERLVLSDEVTI